MKNFIIVCLVLAFATDVSANTPEVKDVQTQGPIWTLGLLGDFGFVVKRRRPNGPNGVINLGFGIVADVDVTNTLRLGFGVGIPSGNIAPSLNIPLSLRFMPFGARQSGIYLQAQIVPTYGHGSPCFFSEKCDIPPPNAGEKRLYAAIGVIGKGGGGFQINFSPVWFFMDGSINTAYFKGIKTKDGYSLDDGIYLGAEMALGVRFPF